MGYRSVPLCCQGLKPSAHKMWGDSTTSKKKLNLSNSHLAANFWTNIWDIGRSLFAVRVWSQATIKCEAIVTHQSLAMRRTFITLRLMSREKVKKNHEYSSNIELLEAAEILRSSEKTCEIKGVSDFMRISWNLCLFFSHRKTNTMAFLRWNPVLNFNAP